MEYIEKGGVVAILIAGIVWLATLYKAGQKSSKETIEKLDELHRKEREQQNSVIQKQFEEMNRNAISGTQALTELNTLVKQMKK